MILPEYFISCDWGTSNFRLSVVQLSSLKVIEEFKSSMGVKVLYQDYLNQNTLNQSDFFSTYLMNKIQLLSQDFQSCLIVSSGMITSNIGLHHLDYSTMPFGINGDDFNSKLIYLQNKMKMLIISGVKDNSGVMRGEETQAIGLAEYLDNSESAILLLPGTHSKHITYNNCYFEKFKTFMTGELFELLTTKSILSNSVKKNNFDEIKKEAFRKGLVLGAANKLTESLFTIRANDLLNQTNKEDNHFFLSGLLLGDELSYLRKTNSKIFLASPYPLSNLYKLALDIVIGDGNYYFFDEQIVSKSMLKGQIKILKRYV